MAIETAALTDVGRRREHNEDSVLVAPTSRGRLLAVADGMGGHEAGDVASETALEAFVTALDEADAASDADALESATLRADEAVRAAASDERGRDGMGTTLVAALVDGEGASVVNVGDSRAYRVGDATIEQVTVDHSLVQELVEAGEISKSEAALHPRRNVVSQALGVKDGVEPDTFTVELDPEETLLLCSDGLTEDVPESTIQEIVSRATSLDDAAATLVETANENGGSDNVSVALGRVR